MKRVMVGALILAFILGAVGCGEKKNDNASLIGGADAFGAEEIIVTPQGVPEETTHEYKPGEGKIENQPNTEGQEGEWLDMEYASVSDYFTNPHEHESMKDGYTKEADLDGDGTPEKIVIEDLKYNGGDGGYLPHVYRANGEEIKLPMDTEVNPYAALWGEKNVEIFQEDVGIAALSWDEVKQIYQSKGYTEETFEELRNNLSKDAWIRGDFASGFVIKDGGERPELIIKFYMQGMGGHADTFGYILMHLTLNSDETWNHEKSEFVLDE
ncbi:hypothetical protein [Butyrivibrio sp. YAB3001]|uniref:hypothetical protein n=1 Tax=Butyrivibrio sp. YAB3001 TaxID=1520812 RepID=UPI0008F62C74|nr:hypothetical protein [Butyrivibrio sp. YAB3001]SFC30228.1 hypothetical protein SAMN02910398_01954 [Butyrivibrio sp. YAB3001]